MKAVIIGGGIGGVAAAIALAMRDWDVTVCEQAQTLTEVGAGLQISPNGWRVLLALGVTDGLGSVLFEPDAIEMRIGLSGRRVFHLPMKGYAQSRWRAPYVQVHRADLLMALVARLDEVAQQCIQTGKRVTSYDPSGSVQFADGSHISADLIVGADGLHSTMRRQMLGPEAPRYTGNVAWRAVVPMDVLDHPPPTTGCVWVGHKKHAVTTQLRAGTLANFVGMVEDPIPTTEEWDAKGHRTEALDAFAGWNPVITDLIAKAPVLNKWALFDRAPLPQWHDGRVALLGDAAHPMLPSMAQGAVQAMEDAWVLAECVSTNAIEAGLARYFKTRIARTSRIQAGSVANARLFHKASGFGRFAFYAPIAVSARIAPEILHRRQDWVYRHDVTAP